MDFEYDYVIVGSGFFGSVFAQQMHEAGKKCIILERRNHIGGNSYTENVGGIHVHKYGPHTFHTADKNIWEYANRFATFNNFVYRPKVNYKNKIFSFPINLMTLQQVFGVRTPDEAQKKLESVRLRISNPKNLEDWILSQVGKELYETFVKGYTTKQWGREPKYLPSFIIKRLPIRTNYDDNYFFDPYQGIPIGGYTAMFEKMQSGIEVILGVDFLAEKTKWESLGRKIVFTGPIDEFFSFSEGTLEYRSLEFETQCLDQEDFQGNAVINYTEEQIPWTRICEHKHFDWVKSDKTVITKEFPAEWSLGKERFYPISNDKNKEIYNGYKKLADKISDKYIFGGRLAEYKYYDMHQVVGSALNKAKKELQVSDQDIYDK
jgi:UDP-galactopyranose mutase